LHGTEKGPKRSSVLLNAGAALYASTGNRTASTIRMIGIRAAAELQDFVRFQCLPLSQHDLLLRFIEASERARYLNHWRKINDILASLASARAYARRGSRKKSSEGQAPGGLASFSPAPRETHFPSSARWLPARRHCLHLRMQEGFAEPRPHRA
jgi:hypothetical protein